MEIDKNNRLKKPKNKPNLKTKEKPKVNVQKSTKVDKKQEKDFQNKVNTLFELSQEIDLYEFISNVVKATKYNKRGYRPYVTKEIIENNLRNHLKNN